MRCPLTARGIRTLGRGVFSALLASATLYHATGVRAAVQDAPKVNVPLPVFEVEFDLGLQPGAYTGRVLVILTQGGRQEPRQRINSFQQWMSPSPVLAQPLKDWDPAKAVILGADAMRYPPGLAELENATWRVQAVARRNVDLPEPGVSPGDLYSDVADLDLATSTSGPVRVRLTHVVKEDKPEEHPRIRTVEMISPLLSKFYGREVRQRAWVRLPQGWEENPERRYPVLYMISGFGGGEPRFESMTMSFGGSPRVEEVLLVVPDSRCLRGHHVFADSENNGPRGTAFVKELIPLVEKTCRGAESPKHRYVTGGSSGGWASLWLQVTYPDAFAGCWSDVPDPVDFRDFQRINLYEPGANMYRDAKGERRPLMRMRDQVRIWYEDFVRAEDVLGPGGQIHSFEAVFSRRGKDGEPEPLFNRTTGAVNPDVAKSWEHYDIRLVLERNWPTLGPKLAGKLHIRAGEFDNFYLEGATRLLKESLSKLGSDADVEIVTGGGHGTLFGPPAAQMLETIVTAFEKEHPQRARSAKPPAPATGEESEAREAEPALP